MARAGEPSPPWALPGCEHHIVEFIEGSHQIFDGDGIFGGFQVLANLAGLEGGLVEARSDLKHLAGVGDFRGLGSVCFHLLYHQCPPAEVSVGAIQFEAGAKGFCLGVVGRAGRRRCGRPTSGGRWRGRVPRGWGRRCAATRRRRSRGPASGGRWRGRSTTRRRWGRRTSWRRDRGTVVVQVKPSGQHGTFSVPGRVQRVWGRWSVFLAILSVSPRAEKSPMKCL